MVTVSEDLKNQMIMSNGIDKKKVLVIHNGIDTEKLYRPESRERTRRALGIKGDDFVIGNIARMVSLKNHRFLINVFKELREDLPGLRLTLIGDGPLKGELEAYAKNMKLTDAIQFLGERKDIGELLSVFDLFVLPSLTEGISMTLIEAMAAGVPIVASRVGGTPEIIENNRTGSVIPLDEPSKWVKEIKSIIKDDQKRKDMAETAKYEVKKRFSLNSMVDRYEKVYYE
jgi:glycosyltransferase involved in cell wall biosynthesis